MAARSSVAAFRLAIVSAVLVTGLAACVTSPAMGTRGTMPPPGPNGEIDPVVVPDFVAVAGPRGIAGYVAKGAVLDPGDATWPVFGDDLRTVVGHMVPGRGFVALGIDPDSVPTFAVDVAPFDPQATATAGVVRAYVRNGADAETWLAVLTLGQVRPGGAGFPGSGYVGIACLPVPAGARLVVLDRSPVDPLASAVETLHFGPTPDESVSLWVDVLPDGTLRTGTGRPTWWTTDSPC